VCEWGKFVDGGGVKGVYEWWLMAKMSQLWARTTPGTAQAGMIRRHESGRRGWVGRRRGGWRVCGGVCEWRVGVNDEVRRA
jgi:hypothetical protein